MTSVETAGATRVAPAKPTSTSKASVLEASLTRNITTQDTTTARATLTAWHGGGHDHGHHGGGGRGPIIVRPRPYYPRPYFRVVRSSWCRCQCHRTASTSAIPVRNTVHVTCAVMLTAVTGAATTSLRASR